MRGGWSRLIIAGWPSKIERIIQDCVEAAESLDYRRVNRGLGTAFALLRASDWVGVRSLRAAFPERFGFGIWWRWFGELLKKFTVNSGEKMSCG
jgi:hypothetical protein